MTIGNFSVTKAIQSSGNLKPALDLGERMLVAGATYTLTDLSNLGPEWQDSYAYGLNNEGEMVGITTTSAGHRAFYWSPQAGMVLLGTLGGGWSRATAINNQGQVVGFTETLEGYTAFCWQVGAPLDALIAIGPNWSRAMGINDAGQVVGCIHRGQHHDTFRWQARTGWQLIPMGDRSCIAAGINNWGQIVGNLCTSDGWRAFLWDEQDGLRSLGALGVDSSATDIDNHGQVTGTLHTGTGDRAFLWTPAGMRDLTLAVDPKLGWTLERAAALNDWGQIVGRGKTATGEERAFLLTPAKPDF